MAVSAHHVRWDEASAQEEYMPYLRDTLSPHSPAQHGPGDLTWVLALEEEGFGFAILEAEDFAVCADKNLALS